MIGQKKHKIILIQYKFKVSADSNTTTTQLQSHSSTGEPDPWSKGPTYAQQTQIQRMVPPVLTDDVHP